MASRGVNMVVLVGNIGSDPEMKYSQSGNAICTLSLATSESWKDKDGNQQERTEWHRVKAFGRLAEIMGEYLKKGRQIYIQGSLRTEKYTDKNGVEKYSTDIIADEMQMLGGAGEGGSGSGGGSGGQRGAGESQSRNGGSGGGDRGGSRGGGGDRGGSGYGARSGGGGGGGGSTGYDHANQGRGSARGHDPIDEDIPFMFDPASGLY